VTCAADVADLIPLLLAVPLLAAALIRVPAVWRRRTWSGVVATGAGVVTAVLGAALALATRAGPIVHHVGGWEPRDGVVIGVTFLVDGFAAGFLAAAGAAVAAALWHSIGSYERTGGMFEVLTLLLLVALSGFVLSADLFSMFVFVELLGITVYALTASKIDDRAAVPAAFNIAVVSALGAVLFLTGATLVYRAAATPNLVAIATELAAAGQAPHSASIGVAFLASGLAFKAGAVPFHFAHLDSHTVARAPHAGLFGAIVVPAGLFGLARLQSLVVPGLGDPAVLRPLLVATAAVTALVGGLLAVAQTHLKRLLACSSVAHVGIALTGLAVADVTGAAGTATYVLGHGAVKLGLFLAVGVLLHRLGSVEVGELVGRGRAAGSPALLLAVGGPLLAGLPPSGLYAGKAMMADAVTAAGLAWLVAVLYLAAGLTGVALVRAAAHLWFGWPLRPDAVGAIAEGSRETLPDAERRKPAFGVVPVVLVLTGGLLALLPQLVPATLAAAAQAADPAVLSTAVGTGPSTSVTVRADPVVWACSSLAWATAAVTLAVVGGLVLARRGRRPVASLPAWARAGAVGFRAVHSGHVGDYTAWGVLGAGVWSTLVLAGSRAWG
jgi:multicomponent Na+:H+ antiporter subunit D